MRWKMLFRIGLTVVVVVAIVLFYLNNILHRNNEKISELVRSENLAFEEALVRHRNRDGNGKQSAFDGKAGPHDPRQNDGRNDDPRKRNDGEEEEKEKGGGGDVEAPGQGMSREKAAGDGVAGEGAKKNGGRLEGERAVAAQAKTAEENGAKAPTALQPAQRRVGKQVHTQVHLIHLAVVACGDRGEETLVMLKSAVILTPSTPLVLHIFAEPELHGFFVEQFSFWPEEVVDRVDYRVYDITFPASEKVEDWKNLFKPCATQRLFIPTFLRDVDSLIYVDTDILFVSPLTKLWSFFSRFNSTQLVALAPEHEDPSSGWYNRFARHPYVPPMGVNSGVMLMNLTRLRRSTWLTSVLAYYKEYRLKITWGDQDLINIYFHFHPEELYIYTCEWNYRPDHCMYMSVCKSAERHGAFVIHGCRRVMHNDKQPAFRALYNAFRNYRFGEDVETVLLQNMKTNLQLTTLTPCGKLPHVFLKQMQEFVMETRGDGPREASDQEAAHGR